MNRIVLGFAALVASFCLIVACKKDDPEPKENQAPTVSVLKPEEGVGYVIVGSDTTFAIEASTTDSDGSISNVEFYIDGTKIGEDNSAPYSFEYTFLPDVEYSIKVIAIDNEGATTTKEFLSVVVIPN